MDGTLTEITTNCTLNSQIIIDAGQVVRIKGVRAEQWRITAASNSRHFDVSGGQLIMENVELYGGTSSGSGGLGYGGAVYIQSGSVTFTDCTFSNNAAQGQNCGGAIAIIGSSVTSVIITRCTFSRNTAYHGGAISNQNWERVTLKSCTFSHNTASGSGGALYVRVSSTTFTNCNFFHNKALQFRGGAIYMKMK